MTDDKLKLLKRYRYDKNATRDRNEEEYTWRASEEVYALDVYEYKFNTYVVKSDWYYKGSGDMEGSDHYESLSFTVYPIKPDDAKNEEVVLLVASGKEGHKTEIGDRPQVDIKSEEAFTRSIRSYVIGAIDAYIADKKKAEALAEKPLPNAVYVSEDNAPEPTVVYDFDSHAGLGTVFYNCTSVGINPLGEESQENLGIARPLCYYYPADRGSVRVYAYIDERRVHRSIGVSIGSKFQMGDSAVICAYVKHKPAPLTPDEVQKILDFPTE